MLIRSPKKTADPGASEFRATENPHPVRFRWLREPLFHFILIGAVIFAASSWRGRQTVERSPKQIVLTEDDLVQMVVTMQAQGLPDPSPEQMKNLIETKVHEEVLYREALAMGLDKNDTIVQRRMAQKMDFLAEDLSQLREPPREELQAWLKSHPQDFASPPRITFRHLYFSFDNHHGRTREAAAAALLKVKNLAADAPEAAALGERFMFQDFYPNRTPDQVRSAFGDKFAQALFQLKPGQWSGPIESGFGWHLVFVDSITPGQTPEFDEIEAEVRSQWQANQRAEFKAEAYRVMREKYEVILPKTDGKDILGKVGKENPKPGHIGF